MIIKQFGLERSGTNAIRALIEANCSNCVVLTTTLGHKHLATSWDAIDEELQSLETSSLEGEAVDLNGVWKAVKERDLRFLISVKDPVSWVWSYFRYSRSKWMRRQPLETFELTSELTDKWLNSWKRRMVSWLRFAKSNADHTMVVQHETLVKDPKRVLEATKVRLGLEWNDGDRELFEDKYATRALAKYGAEVFETGEAFNGDYHLNGDWMREMPEGVQGRAVEFMHEFFDTYRNLKPFFDLQHLSEVERKFDRP